MQDKIVNENHWRRQSDFPVLTLSQDYELFFQRSGSIEKCLIEPCELLGDFAHENGVRITYFVDAGMLCCMERLASTNNSLVRDLGRVRSHITSLAEQGHEIGLHIHPHWEDTSFASGEWDFSGTRYQLSQFSGTEADEIVTRYTRTLNELCDGRVRTYRAGGFCIEPFEDIRGALLREGVTVDSSVVPGALLQDDNKGIDFRGAPDAEWWRFDHILHSLGEFLHGVCDELGQLSGSRFLSGAVCPVIRVLHRPRGHAEYCGLA